MVAIASTSAAALPKPPPPGPAVEARAWAVVDDDTGALVDGHDPHARLRPASTIKVLTALVATADLEPDASVPVSSTAAAMPPERLGMRSGEVWHLDDVLHGLLMVSANDAAVALAERVSGSRKGFATDLRRAGQELGMVDDPVLDDPAGLDDRAAAGDGDKISAYDLAVAARAALRNPAVRQIVGLRGPWRFTAPDGTERRLTAQNKLLADPTVIGIKPGFTASAGETLMAAATRGGRTIISVELGARPGTMYRTAQTLLARGFAAPMTAEASLPHLPGVVLPRTVGAVPLTWPMPSRRGQTSSPLSRTAVAAAIAVGAVALFHQRVARRRPRRRRVARARHGR